MSNIRVVVRTRPSDDYNPDVLGFSESNKKIKVTKKIQRKSEDIINNQREEFAFGCSLVLHNQSQEVCFQECARASVISALDGYNATLITYGASGSGKTYTMLGASEDYAHRGIVPRSLSDIFLQLEQKGLEERVELKVTALEFYNETITDLLAPEDRSIGSKRELDLKDRGSTVVVPNAKHVLVRSESEALRVLFQGQAERATRVRNRNDLSSRSHMIITLHITNYDSAVSTSSKISFVDLAAAEPVRVGDEAGRRIRYEAGTINKSHSYLEQVVLALAARDRGSKSHHVPYRQSKLTHYLKDSIGGNCKTTLVATISAAAGKIVETIHTLRFAERASSIVNRPIINSSETSVGTAKRQAEEIELLRQELAIRDSLDNRKVGLYRPFNHIELVEIEQLASKYVTGDVDTIEVTSVRQAQELFKAFRKMIKSKEQSIVLSPSSTSVAPSASATSSTADTISESSGVGLLEPTGFSVGSSSTGAKMSGKRKSERNLKPSDRGAQADVATEKALSALTHLLNGAAKATVDPSLQPVRIKYEQLKAIAADPGGKARSECKTALETIIEKKADSQDDVSLREIIDTFPDPVDVHKLSRDEAYQYFKDSVGKADGELLEKNNNELRNYRLNIRSIAIELNKLQVEIDEQTAEMNSMHSYFAPEKLNGSEYPVMDAPVFALFQTINKLKAEYKEKRLHHSELYKDCVTLESANRTCRKRLLTHFTDWYGEVTGSTIDLPKLNPRFRSKMPESTMPERVASPEQQYNINKKAVIRQVSNSPEKVQRLKSPVVGLRSRHSSASKTLPML